MHQTDARVAGAGSVAGGGELLGSAKKLDHRTCRGGGVGCSSLLPVALRKIGAGQVRSADIGFSLARDDE